MPSDGSCLTKSPSRSPATSRPTSRKDRRGRPSETLNTALMAQTLEIRLVATFEPVLSRNWNVPDSHTLKVYESRGGYQAARQGADDAGPRQGRQHRQGLGAARPRRRRVPLRAEVELPAEGSEGNVHVRQRRRERAGDVQQPDPDGEGPAPVPRGDPDRLLRHQGDDGLRLSPVRVHQRLPDPGDGDRRGPGGRAPGQEHLRDRLQPRGLGPPRRRGVHLRRGDRADREPRRASGAGRGSSRRSRRSRGRSASRRSSTTSRRSAACRTSSSAAPTGSSRSARPRATARSSTASRGTSTSRSASSCRWASPAAS